MNNEILSALQELVAMCTVIDQRQIHGRYRERFVQALERAKQASGFKEPQPESQPEYRMDEFSSSAGYGGWGHDE